MKSLYRKLVLWLMQGELYNWLMAHVIWRIRFTTYYTSFRGNKYHEGYMHLQPGRFVLTTDSKKFTTFAIPGCFSHAAYCVHKINGTVLAGAAASPEILEMTHLGFTESWFFDLCKEADRIAIFDCLDWDYDYKRKMIESAWTFKGASYDNAFSLGVQALYCSEEIYQADCIAGASLVPPIPTFRNGKYTGSCRMQVSLADLAGLGKPYISPDGLAKAPNVVCIWDSAGELTGLTGDQIRAKLATA